MAPPHLLQLLALACLASTVAGHYCEWDLCGSEQYCCGDNLCCDYVYSLWYFWVGVVFLVLLVSACGGLFRYYYRQWSSAGSGPPYIPFPASPTYTSLPTRISSHDPLFQITEDAVKPKL
ncbi:WW domain-binding protein 1 isoform X1 [Procambarus clarkii]|uniref:WW domain-binding protein 1 isoform X1 n=1 Tax=Procambarus clarkii TaxID=6728 RepID=UPI001E677927|nr:WW domain-binding protein 1-like [Procambarus clarkii]